ncbi:MAG: hypothetical protein H6508_00760 [Calditrichaeota bacterium]|nr:hypothetical protein [Calditrichota bacterium]
MKLLHISVALLWCASVFAQVTEPNSSVGSRPGAFSARSLGLGHTFVTSQEGSAALMGNPATLAFQDSRWTLGASVDLTRVKETRSYPFYDAFDGVLGYNNYALNDHVYSQIEGGVSYRVDQDKLDALVFSAGSYSAYQFDYTYHEEVRNRFSSGGVQDKILGKNILESGGDLRTLSLGAAGAHDQFALGFGLSFLTGDWDYRNGVYFASEDSTDQVFTSEFSPRGTPAEFNLGATCDLSERVRVGLRALLPTGEMKYDYQTTQFIGDSASRYSGTSTVQYPSHIAAGVQYRPRNEFRPMIYGEAEVHTYSEVADGLDDVIELRAGAEQQIVPGTPARFGIVYATSPSDKDRATTLFTAGVGFILRNMRADFGLEFGELNYASDDLFPQSLYGETDRSDRDRVETALFRGMIELSWSL